MITQNKPVDMEPDAVGATEQSRGPARGGGGLLDECATSLSFAATQEHLRAAEAPASS